MYLIYQEFGKARLADLHAQAERDALASAGRRARRERKPPSAPRRPWPGRLRCWLTTRPRLRHRGHGSGVYQAGPAGAPSR
jgi:hypothetical protein